MLLRNSRHISKLGGQRSIRLWSKTGRSKKKINERKRQTDLKLKMICALNKNSEICNKQYAFRSFSIVIELLKIFNFVLSN
jgi:hypothetical protein